MHRRLKSLILRTKGSRSFKHKTTILIHRSNRKMASTQSIEAGNEVAAVPVAANTNDVSVSNESLVRADEYRVGDLVWCQIKSDPYWPARVLDPEHAFDLALRYHRDGCTHFVALLGTDTYAWCEPSQLVPFVENFNQLSKAETKVLFIKGVNEAVEEAERSRPMMNNKDVAAEVLTTPRQRKRSKYLSPPYTDWSFKKGSKCARKAKNSSEDGPVEEGNGMNIALSSLVPADAAPDNADRDEANALSELNAIRQKLEVTSVILKAYHPKFTDEDKATVMEDVNRLKEEVETMSRKVLRLAETPRYLDYEEL